MSDIVAQLQALREDKQIYLDDELIKEYIIQSIDILIDEIKEEL